jgi:hypothetical protein
MLEHSFEIRQHLVIPEAEDVVSQLSQEVRATIIRVCLQSMLSAV